MTKTASKITVPNGPSFVDDEPAIEPYAVGFEIEGTRDYLFNRYDVPVHDDETKKRVKDVRPLGWMVTLDSQGHLAARTVQLWNAIVAAGKYRKNPRTTRGSLATVLKEGIEIEIEDPSPDLLTFRTAAGEFYTTWEWEFTARTARRGAFGQSYVTKVRPGIHPGWRLRGRLVVLLPEYIRETALHEAMEMAGRFGGIGDGRTGGLGFGRFRVVTFAQAAA